MTQWYFLNHPVPAHQAAVLAELQRSRHRTRGAGAHGASRVERQYEVGCVRQRLLKHRGHAVSGNDIKPHARTNDDFRCLRVCVAALRGNEDLDLTGDIKIVCSARKTGMNHRSAGRCEWAGAIHHDHRARDRSRSGWHIVKVKHSHGQTEFGGQLFDGGGTPTG
jgi:hypothetical protein